MANFNPISASVFRRSAVATILLFATGVGGCAVNGNSLSQLSPTDDIVTESVTRSARPAGFAESDATIIQAAVVNASDASDAAPVGWSNPQTGSSGAIVRLKRFEGRHGQSCRDFRTSVTNYTGVAFYVGEVCQTQADRWVLSWFKADG